MISIIGVKCLKCQTFQKFKQNIYDMKKEKLYFSNEINAEMVYPKTLR